MPDTAYWSALRGTTQSSLISNVSCLAKRVHTAHSVLVWIHVFRLFTGITEDGQVKLRLLPGADLAVCAAHHSEQQPGTLPFGRMSEAAGAAVM